MKNINAVTEVLSEIVGLEYVRDNILTFPTPYTIKQIDLIIIKGHPDKTFEFDGKTGEFIKLREDASKAFIQHSACS